LTQFDHHSGNRPFAKVIAGLIEVVVDLKTQKCLRLFGKRRNPIHAAETRAVIRPVIRAPASSFTYSSYECSPHSLRTIVDARAAAAMPFPALRDLSAMKARTNLLHCHEGAIEALYPSQDTDSKHEDGNAAEPDHRSSMAVADANEVAWRVLRSGRRLAVLAPD
jgi:hypothetical protein